MSDNPLDQPLLVPPEVVKGLVSACKIVIKGQNIEINTTLDVTIKVNVGTGEDWGGIDASVVGLKIVRDGETTIIEENGEDTFNESDVISDIVANAVNDCDVYDLTSASEEVKEAKEKLQNLYDRLEESIAVVSEQYGLSEDNILDNVIGLADKELKGEA